MPVPRPGLLLPQSSPPTALPLSGLVPPSPPSFPGRLLLLLLWLLRHTPQSPRDAGAGLGDPLASACTPPDAQTCPARAGLLPGSPRLPLPGSRRPQLSLVRRRREALAGWGRRLGAGGRRAGRGRENLATLASGRGGPTPALVGLAVMGSGAREWDTPPSQGTQEVI